MPSDPGLLSSQLFFLDVVRTLRTLYPEGVRKEARNARRPNMKAKLTLIASAFLLMSNFAGAQEQETPSTEMTGQEAPSAGAQEQKVPTAKMTGQDMMGHMGQGMMRPGIMHPAGMHMRIIFVLMDTDGDGTVSLEEFQTAHAKIFKAIDADKDGKVTFAEMQAFFRGGSPTS